MKHFYRTGLATAEVIRAADEFFTTMGMTTRGTGPRERIFAGELGEVRITARPEGGHYTFVEAGTDQMGESRLDRNVKKFFVGLHRMSHPGHYLEAAY